MVFITWITELINSVPNILAYLVPGYVFLSIYKFITYRSFGSKFEDGIFGCIVASYILKTMFDFVTKCCNLSTISYVSLLVAYSAIFAYILGIVTKNERFNRFLMFIGIDRTPNKDIWTDLVKDKMWVRIYLKGTDISYFGQYFKGEDFGREPIIVLKTYQMLDEESKPFVDYSMDLKRSVVLNTKDFERIELIDP